MLKAMGPQVALRRRSFSGSFCSVLLGASAAATSAEQVPLVTNGSPTYVERDSSPRFLGSREHDAIHTPVTIQTRGSSELELGLVDWPQARLLSALDSMLGGGLYTAPRRAGWAGGDREDDRYDDRYSSRGDDIFDRRDDRFGQVDDPLPRRAEGRFGNSYSPPSSTGEKRPGDFYDKRFGNTPLKTTDDSYWNTPLGSTTDRFGNMPFGSDKRFGATGSDKRFNNTPLGLDVGLEKRLGNLIPGKGAHMDKNNHHDHRHGEHNTYPEHHHQHQNQRYNNGPEDRQFLHPGSKNDRSRERKEYGTDRYGRENAIREENQMVGGGPGFTPDLLTSTARPQNDIRDNIPPSTAIDRRRTPFGRTDDAGYYDQPNPTGWNGRPAYGERRFENLKENDPIVATNRPVGAVLAPSTRPNVDDRPKPEYGSGGKRWS